VEVDKKRVTVLGPIHSVCPKDGKRVWIASRAGGEPSLGGRLKSECVLSCKVGEEGWVRGEKNTPF